MRTNEKIVFESVKKIHQYQQEIISEILYYVSKKSTFYRFIKKNNSLFEIPFTTKQDLSLFNDDFLCVPKRNIIDYTTTSGTEGAPVSIYLDAKDLKRLAYNEYVSMKNIGATSKDVFQLITTMDKRFMAGLAYYKGIEKLKAGVVRVGPGVSLLQWDSIQRFGSTILIAIPSFIPKLIEFAKEQNIDFRGSSIKKILCIGEPIRDEQLQLNEMSKLILNEWNVKLFSTYASTEMGAAFTECESTCGVHLNPDLLFLEVIDENDKHVHSGDIGEVVITTLQTSAMPLIRYKTGDLCKVYYEKCSCGRNTPRLGPVIGRKQQMIKLKGTTIFPNSIIDSLTKIKEIKLFQIIVKKNEYQQDDVILVLDNSCNNPQIIQKIQSTLSSTIRVRIPIEFLSFEQLSSNVFNENNRKPNKIVYI